MRPLRCPKCNAKCTKVWKQHACVHARSGTTSSVTQAVWACLDCEHVVQLRTMPAKWWYEKPKGFVRLRTLV